MAATTMMTSDYNYIALDDLQSFWKSKEVRFHSPVFTKMCFTKQFCGESLLSRSGIEKLTIANWSDIFPFLDRYMAHWFQKFL